MTIRVEPEFIYWEDALRINLYRSSTDLLVTAATDKETNATQTGGNTSQGIAQAAQGTTQAIQDTGQATQGTTQDTTQALQNTIQDRGEESNWKRLEIKYAVVRSFESFC